MTALADSVEGSAYGQKSKVATFVSFLARWGAKFVNLLSRWGAKFVSFLARWGATFVNVLIVLALIAIVGFSLHALGQEAPETPECAVPVGADDVAAKAAEARRRVRTDVKDARRDVAREVRRLPAGDASSPALREARRALGAKEAVAAKWAPVTLTVDPKAQTNFLMGHDVYVGERSVRFTTSARVPGGRFLAVTAGQFVTTGAGREFGPETVKTWAQLDSDRRGGTMFLCVPEKSRDSDASGVYSGSLAVADPRVEGTRVPVSLSLAYPKRYNVVGVGLLVCLLSSLYVFFLRREGLPSYILYGTEGAPSEADKRRADWVLRWRPGFFGGYFRFFTSVHGVVTLVAGLLSAATAFSLTYLEADAWAGTPVDWFTYCGAVATAFIAGGTAGKLVEIGGDTRGPDGTRARQGGDPESRAG